MATNVEASLSELVDWVLKAPSDAQMDWGVLPSMDLAEVGE